MKDGKYESFDELRKAWLGKKVDSDEYEKYFGGLTGCCHEGYPDFYKEYRELLGAVDVKETRIAKERKETSVSDAKAKKASKLKYIVVNGEANDYGDIKCLHRAFLFPLMKDAMKFMNDIAIRNNGKFITSTAMMLPDGTYYAVLKEASPNGQT